MKCDICGTESEFEAAFFKERKLFRKSVRTVCPGCRVRRRKAFEGWYQIAILLGGAVGYVLLWLNPWSRLGHFLTALFLINIFCILSIVPHELGHAIVGRLVGWRVFAIVIGVGKQLLKFNLFGILFSFHWLPVAGVTQAAPVNGKWFRIKCFFVFLAGPAVNAAIVAIILWIWRDPWQEMGLIGLPRPARLCLWANLAILVVNLWPRRTAVMGMATDGKQLLKLFSRKKEDVEELQAMRFVLEAMFRRDEHKDMAGALDWCNKGLALYPGNVHLLNLSGILCLDEQKYDRAREIFIQLLERQTKTDRTRYILLNNIAYVDALIGDPALLPEADAYSKEAFAIAGWAPAIIGTRGTVLVEMGNFEEGIKLLKQSMERHGVPRNKALNACHLAIAYARNGNHDEANNCLKLARQLDSQCQLIGRAEAELGRSSEPTDTSAPVTG